MKLLIAGIILICFVGITWLASAITNYIDEVTKEEFKNKENDKR